MNLENLNVVELNAQEMQNTDGGIGPLVVKILEGLAILAGGAVMLHDQNCSKCNNDGVTIYYGPDGGAGGSW